MNLVDILHDARSLLSGVSAILQPAEKPVRVTVRSIPLFVRPRTPSLDAAKGSSRYARTAKIDPFVT